MVCLNRYISFDKIKLKNNLSKELNESIKLEFDIYYYNNEKIKNIFEKIYKHINDKTKELFENNHFLYINMNDNICSHMYKKGKQEGYFCCKKITKNGNKKESVCTKHNKSHIPKKKLKIKNNKNSKNCKIFENDKNIDNSIIKMNINKNKIIKNRLKNNFSKIKKRKFKINIYGEINFNYILKRFSQEILP